jgi:peptidoglycan/xylan/chitin deacetylase (PgdA/CDA1 family)
MPAPGLPKHWFHALDHWLGRTALRWPGEGGGLVVLMFHSLFADQAELATQASIDPQQRTTVADLRVLVRALRGQGYQFVTPAQVLAGLPPRRRHAMLTFDDGYHNNLRALPVLHEFGVPAVFFITANHVLHHKCMWSDVLYRERTRQGAPLAQIRAEQEGLKHLRAPQIEQHLRQLFGPECLQPWGDLDRFLTPAELAEFARDPLVVIGNHTQDHAILTNYDPDGIRREVADCQRSLAELTGRLPDSIAYPNGNHSLLVRDICRELGLRLGIGVHRGKNYLPLRPGDELALLRHTYWGDRDLRAQVDDFRQDAPLWKLYQNWK